MNKKLLKSILAIVVGFILVAVLSVGTDTILEATGVFPPITHPELYTSGHLLFALIFRIVYAGVGGYVTALLSPGKGMRDAMILAGIGFVVAVIGALSHVDLGNIWYPILLAILSPFAVIVGARLKTK